jgi:hypothetical protein
MFELLTLMGIAALVYWYMHPNTINPPPKQPRSFPAMEGLGRFVRKLRQGEPAEKTAPAPEPKITSSKTFDL